MIRIIPFNIWDVVLFCADKMKKFKAENAVVAVVTTSISNDEIFHFSKKITDNFNIKWYYIHYLMRNGLVLRNRDEVKRRNPAGMSGQRMVKHNDRIFSLENVGKAPKE